MVLIVAKCNVNQCSSSGCLEETLVLIVAKCNVNPRLRPTVDRLIDVLIVAKCNVNLKEANAAVIKIKY